MEAQSIEAQLKELREPAQRIFKALYKCKGWVTRKTLAKSIGHKTLFLYDRSLLAQMVTAGLVEEDKQDMEIMVRYRYRVPEEVRSALQRLIAERQKPRPQTVEAS